ncbi:MAG: type III polyketide synthase [Candidatus Omnitrophica bacterium]|nr:type III polyketide synthase [Candidatus Omnitrophota bacterium]
MSSIKIVDIATANPPLKMTQAEILSRILASPLRSKREKKLYSRFLAEASIETRYTAMEGPPEGLFEETQDEAIVRFQEQATRLGTQAVKDLLAKTRLKPSEVDAIIIATCTGYLCPGLTSYISQGVGLREDVHPVDMVGVGCGAALPAMKSAWQYLSVHPDANVIVLAVEICTATSFWNDNLDLIISNSIFGDGAAACLMTNKPEAGGLEIQAFKSILWPEYRDSLRYVTKNGRLHNVLNKEVPVIAAKAFHQVLKQLTNDFSHKIDHYAVHPGGRKILDEIETISHFDAGVLQHSRDVLFNYGNMSSPSVLYVLKDIISKENLKTGDTVGIFAFGAGLTSFGALTKWNGGVNHELCQ